MTKTPKSRTNAVLREAQLAWLADLEAKTDKTATEIARAADLDPSTLSRFKASSDRTLSSLTIRQISAHWQFPAPQEAGGDQSTAGFAEEATPYKVAGKASNLDDAIRALSAGRNNCDPWTIRARTLEAIGYLPGDIVLVDLSAEAKDGDAVLAQIYDFERMKATTVWRRLRMLGTIQLLLPATFDPSLSEPLLVNGKDVAVKGVVLPYRLRPVDKAA